LITGSPTKLNIKHFFSGRQQYEPVIEISTTHPPPYTLVNWISNRAGDRFTKGRKS
jgi:hypothetical protein